ncbi:TIGR03619 family F420-dependent LLM class oxidoreductase [Actinoplanes sp. RD1]|uniref:TIGR03619 family F420-dependent LLM class oxidoreductase n=1 Tax=Actinoplanes sp. RD1 TaxID=3064538 RepID=UPI0027412FD4|nr:TIGR03619 family F420-dependent LLM class oxidoreductase [Actinoplanes sp. RD1]
MELGIALPTSGPLASPDSIVRIAGAADELGYSTIYTYERLLRPIAPAVPGPDGTLERLPEAYRLTYEPLETLSHVAATTTRVKLGTSCLIALLHTPVMLARRLATLDRFSGGRVVAGLGQGWLPQEFAAAGVPLRRRGAGMDDFVAALRACWGPDPVAYEGRFYAIEASEVNPKPLQEHLPILLAANSEGGLRRAARIADGINPSGFSAEQVSAAVRTFREEAAAHGRDPATLPVVVRAVAPMSAHPLGPDRPFLGGSPAEIAEQLKPLAEAGVTEVILGDPPYESVDADLRLYEDLITLVG